MRLRDEAECGYTNKWRELLQSMSWLRPGDKFDKRTTYPRF